MAVACTEPPEAQLLHGLPGLCQWSMPSTYVLVYSWGCRVRATLQYSLTSMSQETCRQHCTLLNKRGKLVPEESSETDKGSHERGKILRQLLSVTALAITVLCHYSESQPLLRAPALGSSKYIFYLISKSIYSLYQIKKHL